MTACSCKALVGFSNAEKSELLQTGPIPCRACTQSSLKCYAEFMDLSALLTPLRVKKEAKELQCTATKAVFLETQAEYAVEKLRPHFSSSCIMKFVSALNKHTEAKLELCKATCEYDIKMADFRRLSQIHALCKMAEHNCYLLTQEVYARLCDA